MGCGIAVISGFDIGWSCFVELRYGTQSGGACSLIVRPSLNPLARDVGQFLLIGLLFTFSDLTFGVRVVVIETRLNNPARNGGVGHQLDLFIFCPTLARLIADPLVNGLQGLKAFFSSEITGTNFFSR